MPVRLKTRGRRARKPATRKKFGVAPVLAVTLVGLALVGGQYRTLERSEANAEALSHPLSSSASDDARLESQGCLPDGSAFVKVALSGAVEHDIEWHGDDMECGGHGNTLQFGGVPAGASSAVDLIFDIEVAEGATGTNLPARVAITDRASGRHFQTSEAGGCTADVTEQTLIEENPAFRRYKLAANGHCTLTSKQYSPGPGAGVSEIMVGEWQIVGLSFRQGPRP